MHWWDQHVEDLETTDLEEICHQVLDLYAQPVTATKDALVSPPPGAAPKVSHFSLFLGCGKPHKGCLNSKVYVLNCSNDLGS